MKMLVVRGPLFVEHDFVFAGSQLKKKILAELFYLPEGLGFISFRPAQRKEIAEKPLRPLRALMSAANGCEGLF